ncbi:ATP-binding protein [Actinomadura atramentaria]|uniref:ATP-binding protein n=1 Tax=Actinomadura atramentaria TaxID=1990 RepID=UPI000368E9A9|nr:BTAD domain-containing putative transcriptional regulator [Actinomadura atramentaria]
MRSGAAGVRVAVLGPVGIIRDGVLLSPSSGISRALLGALATAGAIGLRDDALVSLLWGEREASVSASALAVAVYRLRRWLRDALDDAPLASPDALTDVPPEARSDRLPGTARGALLGPARGIPRDGPPAEHGALAGDRDAPPGYAGGALSGDQSGDMRGAHGDVPQGMCDDARGNTAGEPPEPSCSRTPGALSDDSPKPTDGDSPETARPGVATGMREAVPGAARHDATDRARAAAVSDPRDSTPNDADENARDGGTDHRAAVTVVRTANGYALRTPGASIDAELFRAAVQRARGLDPADRATTLEHALALWRGRALEDAAALDPAVADRLEQERLTATLEHAAATTTTGAPERALPWLAPLVEQHPLDERLLAVWIETLAGCGRQAEALEAFERTRERLRDQLGVDPSPHLRAAHLRVMRQEIPAPESAPARPRPDELPPAVADFTGRERQLADVLAGGALTVVSGMGGIGKTALAVEAAHRAGAHHPGGRLFVDLRGTEPDPADPGEVLGRFLRAFGVAGEALPESAADRTALFRTLAAEHGVLVVLDNAADERQVAPLLPAGPRSRAIVTSRARLTGLPGVRLVELDVLEPTQSAVLLKRVLGADRVAAEPEAVAALADLCGHLPLALRVAGARLAAKPHWGIAGFAERLRGGGRLDVLAQRGLSVRGALDVGYRTLDARTRRLYRLLGLLDAPDFAGWVAAALLDAPPDDAVDVLERLVDAQLVAPAGRSADDAPRYRLHDLVREHARERCLAADPPEARRAALLRALGGWLALTDTVVDLVAAGGDVPARGSAERFDPGSSARRRAATRSPGWLAAERLALAAAVRQAARLGSDELCWELAVRSAVLFQPAHYVEAWRSALDDALAATEAAGNRRGAAAVLVLAAELACQRRDYRGAFDAVRRALRLHVEAGDGHGQGLALRQLATVHRMTGEFAAAVDECGRARDLLRAAGDTAGEARAVLIVGGVELERGAPETALTVLGTARRLAREVGYTGVEVQAAYWTGQALLALGRPAEAAALFGYVGEAATAAGSRLGDMYAAHGLGCAHAALGRPAEAEAELRTALHRARDRGDRLMRARVQYALAELYRSGGEPERARPLVAAALDLCEELAVPLWRARCLLLLADVLADLGDAESAAGPRRTGRALLAGLGVRAEHLPR